MAADDKSIKWEKEDKIMARKKIVAGNWKMNMTPSQAVKLVEELKPLVVSDDVEVVYCVPAIDIVPVVEAVKGTNVAVGAENMYYCLLYTSSFGCRCFIGNFSAHLLQICRFFYPESQCADRAENSTA